MLRALCVALAIAGCAAPSTGAGALSLAGTEWRRVDRAADAPHSPTLAFDAERASGSSGCNRWGAEYELSGDQLRFNGGMMTEMACDEPRMATEAAFMPLIEQARGVRQDGDALVLLDADGAQIARLERVR